MDTPVSSPIPWPRSDKKRNQCLLTPGSRDGKNKLSSKNSGKKSTQSTPRRSWSKWFQPTGSEVATFNRLYNEITNSSTDGLGSDNQNDGTPKCSTQTEDLRKDSLSPIIGLNRRKNRIVDSDSDSLGSSSSCKIPISKSVNPQKKKTDITKNSNKHKILSDSSSDDDSFTLPPPLHQRIPLVTSSNFLDRERSSTKIKQVKPHVKTKGKENISSMKKNCEKSVIVIDSSSSDDSFPDVPTAGLDRRNENPLTYYNIISGIPKMGINNPANVSSSKYKLQDVKTTVFTKESTSSGFNGLYHLWDDKKEPNLPVVTPKCSKTNNPKTLPKSFKHQSILTTPQGSRNHLHKSSLSLSSSDPELPDLAQSRTLRKENRIVLDTSSESELPDIPKMTISEGQTPKFLLPKTTSSSSSQMTTGTTLPGTPKLWISQDLLTESSRFLKSLSDNAPIESVSADFRKKFSKHKEDLVKRLYKLYNESVFESRLPADMSITWNIRLTKTAGYCYMRCHKDQTRTARIELSLKILDSAERVRDTLLHEMCHAAAFIVHGYRDGHGPLFKFWGKKAGVLFPFLPVVSRCHTYKINTKYVYRCTGCKQSIGRHSKSLDMSRKVCGRCRGRFELLVNGVVHTPKQKKTPEFAKFVKENYKQVKQRNQEMKHADVMQKLGVLFSEKVKV